MKDGKDLYGKLFLYSSADEDGKCWQILPIMRENIDAEPLRENDLVELAEWIARELGWIRRSKD